MFKDIKENREIREKIRENNYNREMENVKGF